MVVGYRDLITRTYVLLDRSSAGLRVDLDRLATSRELVDGTVRGGLRGSVGSAGPERDLVGTYGGPVYLVSERFIDVLRTHELDGWQVEQCDVAGLQGGRLSLLQILGRAGRQWVWTGVDDDPIESDPEPGDGLDFFLAEGSSRIYLSPRAASTLDAARLRNVEVEPQDVVFLPRTG